MNWNMEPTRWRFARTHSAVARVVIIDDLLATGGTANAACELVESLGAKVAGVLVMIELSFLNGVERLKPHDVHSLIRY